MALWHDFHKPSRLGFWLERWRDLFYRGVTAGPTEERPREGTVEGGDAHRRELVVAWLLALMVMAAIFAASFADGPPTTRTSRPAGELPACSDLDYAYERC